MSYDNRTSEQTDLLAMASDGANYSGAPTNSADVDWNWTRRADEIDRVALSSGLRASVVFALSILILAGTLMNLVTVVTHLQTSNHYCSQLQRN